MPETCEPAELIENARCLDACIPKGLQMAVLILLFGELVTMPSDADTLLEDAKCLDNCIPDGAKMSVLISLACQLVQQGGGGGGTGAQQVYSFAGNPNGNVTVTTALPCVCIDTTTGQLYQKTDGLLTNTGWV